MSQNESAASQEGRAVRLAALDWAMTPIQLIEKDLSCTTKAIYGLRQTEFYKTTLEEIRGAWHEQVQRLPNTGMLRQKISHAFAIVAERLIKLVADEKVNNRDFIAAARLIAHLDGRFLNETVGDDGPLHNQEDMVAELRMAIERHKKQDSVQ